MLDIWARQSFEVRQKTTLLKIVNNPKVCGLRVGLGMRLTTLYKMLSLVHIIGAIPMDSLTTKTERKG